MLPFSMLPAWERQGEWAPNAGSHKLKLGGINIPLIFQEPRREMLIALSYSQGHWEVWLDKALKNAKYFEK